MNAMNPNQSSAALSRRRFLKTTASLSLGSVVMGRSLAAVLEGRGAVALVVASDDAIATSAPPAWALGELEAALIAQGATVRRIGRVAESATTEFCVLATGLGSPLAQAILRQRQVSAPTEAESLCLVSGKAEGRTVLLAGGADARGLVYALTELADRVSCLATGRAALELAAPVVERPASRTRSVIRGFNSEVEDKVWFYDRDYWRSYLTMLVYARINRVNFTMGMGYNSANNISDGYFLFPYPFFVTVPGRDVRARGLAAGERERNLGMLQFVGEECARRGLRLQLGIWTLAYAWRSSPKATYTIAGLTDATHAAYCRDALAILLREVPAISGVTFRVHEESGIPRGQENFWQTQFSAIAQCGRRVEIDLHAKNMTPETLELALATGQPTVISPKYCGEHLSLPYHQASIRELEMSPEGSLTDPGTGVLHGNRKFTRYGYADSLAENRTWDVVFRIWPGTQRFLLAGDPATFAGYGRHASFCGAAGIELSEPLHFKGRQGSGVTGGRCGYTDASLTPRYDFDKYRYTYRLWGRLGYHPDADPEVWRRALRQEFGAAALAVEQALGPVSRVLPLFTLAHGISANCVFYWPEIYTNLPIADTATKTNWDMAPPLRFGHVGAMDPQLFLSPDECGDALVAGRPTGKYSPLEVAQWLEDIAAAADAGILAARAQLGAAAVQPAFRRIEEDVLILRGLAVFFAAKFRSAVLWRIHTLTGSRAAGEAAVARYVEGRNAWAAMAERAQGVYRPDITYGRGRTSGHWQDMIPDFDADIADLRRRLATPAAPTKEADAAAGERALKVAGAKPVRPTVAVEHTPAEKFRAGQPLAVALRSGAAAPVRVVLHYRHVNQAERWQAVDLTRDGAAWRGEIPAAYTSGRYALQYYFEIVTGPTAATLLPPLAADLANTPYFVARRSA